MSAKSASVIRFELKRSNRLAVIIVLMHAAAFAACVFSQLDDALQLLIFFLLSLSLSLHLRQAAGPPATREILVRTDGWWVLSSRPGDLPKRVELRGETLCSTWLVLLVWRESRRLGYQLILPDHLGRDEFRRLRVVLSMAQVGELG